MESNTPQPTEEWRPVVGYEGLYEVSNLGRVKSLDRIETIKHYRSKTGFIKRKRKGRILKPKKTHKGYLRVVFKRRGKDYPIHHLVLGTFAHPRPGGYIANHKNGIKSDNRIENLEWCTYKYNRHHSIQIGLSRSNKGKTWKHLSFQQKNEIHEKYGKIKTRILAKKFGVSQTTISRFGLGQTFVKPRDNRGSKNSHSKLIESQITEIREKYEDKKYTLKALAEEYGVSFQLISLIINHKIWRHI